MLADVIEGKVDKKHVFYQAHGENDRDDGDGDRLFADEDEISYGGHVIDDDDQEQSDVDMTEDDNVDDDNLDDCDIDDHDGDDYSADDNDIGDDDYYNGGGDDNVKEEEENDDHDVVDDEDEEDDEKESNKSNNMCHYTPVAGEDIYGRSIPTSTNKDDKSIYLPPAKRKQQQLLLQQQQMQQQSKSTIRNLNIDDDNEKTQLLRRQINGLMNKLSFQSKDTILRSLKQIFENNSIMICSIILKDTILLACSNTSQLMLTIIPIYATIIASLHCIVNIDIGAIIIEFLINCFYKSFHDICYDNDSSYDVNNNNDNNNNNYNKTTLNHNGDTKKRLISSKLPANILLLLIYLYNLRIIYHTLIVDILKELTLSQAVESSLSSSTSLSVSLPLSSSAPSSLSKHQMFLIETKVELIECILNHCGNSIRNDDPMSLKLIIQNFSKDYSYLLHSTSRNSNDDNNHENHSDGNADNNNKNDDDDDDDDRNNVITVNSRLKFMFESLSDLKNNKSRRIQKANDENVKQLRKWLGNVKTVLKSNNNSNTENTCLRISLSDLLNADLKGRWWKTGDTCSYINIELKISYKTMLLTNILVKNVYMLIHHSRKRNENILNE